MAVTKGPMIPMPINISTDQFGGASTNVLQALKERLADLKQLLEVNPTLSSSEVALISPYEVRVSNVSEHGLNYRLQKSFPNYTQYDTSSGFNNLIDAIWDLRREEEQEPRFDPLLYLGDDVMHIVVLYAVSLWDIAENRARETGIASRRQMISPFALTGVSRRWSQFIISSPQLWSYLLIDTDDDDALEYVQLSLLLSRNTRLFIVLHGSTVLCDAIVIALLRASDHINALVYPPNVSRSTLAKFPPGLVAEHYPTCPWHRLEMQSVMRSQKHTNHFSFPTSIQCLWLDGLFPPYNLISLSHFPSLSFLSMRISPDRGLSLAPKSRLELPNLERLGLQMALASDQRLEMPIVMNCAKLKSLHLRHTLELNVDNPQEDTPSWLKFEGVDALQELQIHLTIHVVPTASLINPLLKRLQRERVEARERERERGYEREVRELQMFLRLQQMALRKRLQQTVLGEALMRQAPLSQQAKLKQQQMELRTEMLLLQFMTSMQTNWRQWLNLPEFLGNVRQSSLEITLSTHGGVDDFIVEMVVESLLLGMPQLLELRSSQIHHIFPKHLQTVYLRGFSLPGLLSPINLPSLVSLDISADGLDHLLMIIMRYIQAPRLRDLRVQVQDGSGEMHEFDWRDTTATLLDRISLEVDIPYHKQNDYVLVFRLPQTHCLNISSPHVPLRLFLTESTPLPYTLRARLGKLSAAWQESLVTEWTNPYHGIPDLTNFGKLMSLRRLVLDSSKCILRRQSPIDELFKLLANNIHICPQLTFITVAQCPSSWPRFLCDLRMRNLGAMFTGTKCIEKLWFYQPLHAMIIRWLIDAIKTKVLNVTKGPPVRQGDGWPMRPFVVGKRVFRSCYICYITGMEPGCLECETQSVDCGRERGNGSKIEMF